MGLSLAFSLLVCACVCLSRTVSLIECAVKVVGSARMGFGGCSAGGRRRDISRSSPGTWKRRPPITYRRVASVAWTTVACCILFGVKRKLKKKNHVREAESCFSIFLTGVFWHLHGYSPESPRSRLFIHVPALPFSDSSSFYFPALFGGLCTGMHLL